MKKYIITLTLSTALLSCKKESKCRTCGIDQYSSTYGIWIATAKMEDFCGTDKELKEYKEMKLKQNIKIKCD